MRIRRRKTRWFAERTRGSLRGTMSMLGLLGGILLAGAISGLCFLYLWQGNRIQELTAASEEASERLEAAQEINRILSVRIEAAFSLERIARIAREQLGMSEPEPTEIRYVPLSIDESS